MAPLDMKISLKDMFPSNKQVRANKKSETDIQHFMAKFIAEHQSEIPISVLEKSDFYKYKKVDIK